MARIFLWRCAFLLVAISWQSCSENTPVSVNLPVFESLPSEVTGLKFQNTVKNTTEFNILNYRNFYNGGGVAIGDLNNDGLPEVFLTSNMGENKLYLNKGNLRFNDITLSAGIKNRGKWGTGVSFVDINGDGWLDIYVCFAGYQKGKDQRNELYINNKDLTFTENAAAYNLDENGYTTQASFFDFDKDGDLDVYILNNSFITVSSLDYSNKRELPAAHWPVEDHMKGGGDKLLRNENGHFKDVTEASGIYNSLIGFGLGVMVSDLNQDGWEDIYVSNDFFERDYLYINTGKGYFNEEIRDRVGHMSSFSMGVDAADINSDGFMDLFTTDMLPDDRTRLITTTSFEDYNTFKLKLSRDFHYQYMQNSMQINRGNGTFQEIAHYGGVAASDWSWSALLFDMNNDGHRDIYVANGIYQDVTNQDFVDFFANEAVMEMAIAGSELPLDDILQKIPSTPLRNKIFINNGDYTFTDVHDTDIIPTFSNGSAYGDLDGDGDLDLVVNNVNQDALVLKNNTTETLQNHFLKVNLVGDKGNVFSIGAKVTLYAAEKKWVAEQMPVRGFQSSVDYTLSFGLGKVNKIDSLFVEWPDGLQTRMLNLAVDTLLQIQKQVNKAHLKSKKQDITKPLLREIETHFSAFKEDEFVDFYSEGLAIKMLSKEGPVAAIGDVDGNGYSDIFIGAPQGSAAQLYLQDAKGFALTKSSGLEGEGRFDDTACTFFDADNDGDLDLFVGSGGNHISKGAAIQDRIYINNGEGHFVLQPEALESGGLNTGSVLVYDFDADGDNDLIVGSRSVPMNYGMKPNHFVYQNDGSGKFKNVQELVIPELDQAGMIIDMILADIDGDKKNEIIVVGEWMAPMIFKQSGKKFVKMTTGLEGKSGWWTAVHANDVDADGDMDLILGNRGENFYFTADSINPAKLWVNDFDDNGTHEAIITTHINGRDWPIHTKRDLTEQIIGLRKQNLKFSDFAVKSIDLLFDSDVLNKSQVLDVTYFKSAIAINIGQGKFELKPLPAEAQFSSINSMVTVDVNGDHLSDLIIAGNDSNFIPQFSRLDASSGDVLLNNGQGEYRRLPFIRSGLDVSGDVKQLLHFEREGKDFLLFIINGKEPRLFELQE